MSLIYTGLVILGLLLAMPFIGLPVLVFISYQMKLRPQLVPFVPSPNSMLLRTFNHFVNSYVAQQKQGFELLICLKMPGAVTNVDCSLALLANRNTADMAMITAIDAEGQDQPHLYVEIVRRFKNGDVLQTNNSKNLSGLPDMENHTTFRLPQIGDPEQLFHLHQALIARQAPRSQAVLRLDDEFGGDAMEYLLAVYPETLVDAVQRGILYQPAGADYVCCTIYGAFRLSWQEIWPISAIRRNRRDREARELLAELSYAVPETVGK